MVETYPISLAIVDFLPNIAFLIGAYFLVRIAAMVNGRKCSRMVMAGSVLIALGGILKATWKLIYASGAGDVRLLSEIQFVLIAPGFLAILVAVILIARKRAISKRKAAPMLLIVPWKLPFLFIMTLASLGAQGILTYISFRRGTRQAAVGFIVAFMALLAMGMMASAEQTLGMQWIEESINTLGQLGFMTGSILLYKNYKTLGCDIPAED